MQQVAQAQVEYVRQWVEGKRPPSQVATGGTTTVQGLFAPMAAGKMPPVQVVVSDHHHVCKWSTCAVD